jgi:hypothetical protein
MGMVSVPAISENIVNLWRSKLDAERQRLADIEVGRVVADEKTTRFLRRMIPKLEEIVRNAERLNGKGP